MTRKTLNDEGNSFKNAQRQSKAKKPENVEHFDDYFAIFMKFKHAKI